MTIWAENTGTLQEKWKHACAKMGAETLAILASNAASHKRELSITATSTNENKTNNLGRAEVWKADSGSFQAQDGSIFSCWY